MVKDLVRYGNCAGRNSRLNNFAVKIIGNPESSSSSKRDCEILEIWIQRDVEWHSILSLAIARCVNDVQTIKLQLKVMCIVEPVVLWLVITFWGLSVYWELVKNRQVGGLYCYYNQSENTIVFRLHVEELYRSYSQSWNTIVFGWILFEILHLCKQCRFEPKVICSW